MIQLNMKLMVVTVKKSWNSLMIVMQKVGSD